MASELNLQYDKKSYNCLESQLDYIEQYEDSVIRNYNFNDVTSKLDPPTVISWSIASSLPSPPEPSISKSDVYSVVLPNVAIYYSPPCPA